jgi:tetratricopeptide (TPR) repeat protein
MNAYYVFHPVFSVFETRAILSFCVTASFIILSVLALRKNRTVFFALVLITAPLLPVLYIPGLGENAFTDRYLYLPSAGFVMLAGVAFTWKKAAKPKFFYVLVSSFFIITVLYSAGTIRRNAVWKNDFALYSDMVIKSPDAFVPNNNLGFALMKMGRFQEAKKHLEIALRLKPDMLNILISKSTFYIKKGFVDKAILELNNTLFLEPGRADAHYYLGLAYAIKGWLKQAVDEYTEALRLKPDYPHIHNNLAEVYAMQGRTYEAMSEYDAALKSDPSDAQASNNLGILYLRVNQLDKAIALFQTAVRLKPDDLTFRRNLEGTLRLKTKY